MYTGPYFCFELPCVGSVLNVCLTCRPVSRSRSLTVLSHDHDYSIETGLPSATNSSKLLDIIAYSLRKRQCNFCEGMIIMFEVENLSLPTQSLINCKTTTCETGARGAI